MSHVTRCPGPSRKDFHPDDIFLAPCPKCGAEIEFWRDDEMRSCPKCKEPAPNPRKAAKA